MTNFSCHHVSLEKDGKPILHEISAQFSQSRLITLLGPNGAGKSTLLRCLAGLEQQVTPMIELYGKSLSEYTSSQLAEHIAWLPTEVQSTIDFEVHYLTVLGRYAFHQGYPTSNDHLICNRWLAHFEMNGSEQRPISTLSSGEKKRVHLASTLASECNIVLLDEPTANLDIKHAITCFKLLRDYAHQNQKTVINASHDLNLSFKFSDQVIFLSKGRIEYIWNKGEVIQLGKLKAIYDVDFYETSTPHDRVKSINIQPVL